MRSNSVLLSLGALALAEAQSQVQGPPPAPVVLSTTKSGVLPIIPTETPFTGVDTLEGAIINPGPPIPGFVGPGGSATAQTGLPVATYRAELPSEMFNPLVGSTIQGSVEGVGSIDGVRFMVNFTNLPDMAQYGPFGYHIHTLPVPEDGNCTATMGHLDPTNRGELHMCDTSAPETCQVGDLAGKHGKIMTPENFTATYVDPFLSTDPNSPAFFGGLSIVVHTANTTRLTCANFVQVGGNGTTGGASGSGTTGMPSPTSTSPAEFPGAAIKVEMGWMALGAAFAAFFL